MPHRQAAPLQALETRSTPLLRVKSLKVSFGGIQALDGIDFEVNRGEIFGLIGPNGAGKTTLFNCLSGVNTPQRGVIELDGRNVAAMPPHLLAQQGVARTFQNLALFDSMTVQDNILCARYASAREGWLAHALAGQRVAAEESVARARADELIVRMGLADLAERRVTELPLGTRKRVELARALACAPRLLLLDEPASGLTVAELDSLANLIASVASEQGITVLLIEHRMRLVRAICDRVLALNFGKKIAEGKPAEVAADPEVISAWMGHVQ